jgi:hypothetical protein
MSALLYLKQVVAVGFALGVGLVTYGWVRRLLDIVAPTP